ncbi:MAG: hypothetical protein V3U11_08500 [Planctomycetota bacterium]
MSTAAQHLEGQEAPTLPDAEKGKIKDLTDYCRTVGTWPDGWTKMKAAEKRKAFRRLFCPEATETFDSNDPLHIIAERVENLTKEDVMPAIKRLTNDVGMDYFELGGVLARCTEKGWYSEFGFDTAKEWVEDQTDMKYRKAQYLVKLYTKFVELEIPWEKLSQIGWSKLGLVADVVNQENVDRWIETAKALSYRLLSEEIKKARNAATGENGEKSDESSTSKLWNVRLFKDQEETVNAAIELVGKDSNKDGRAICLEFMAAACLAGQFGIQDLQAPAPKMDSLEDVALMAKAVLLKAKALGFDPTYEALEPLMKFFDATFPKANVTLEVEED